MTAPKAVLAIRVGRKSYPVADYAEASRMVEAARDRSGVGVSHFPDALIFEGDALVAHVSYNGRVWAGHPRAWKPGDAPLFDNRVPEPGR
ncbi:MAG TPA: hypothetical protein VMI56_17150 [Reyranella sp.]|nr:hypothetical protein [Reyranella sp.]